MRDSNGERFVPELDSAEISHEHWHRYQLAAHVGEGRGILDIGSGEGYGAALLATRGKHVVGIDIDPGVIQHAARRYRAHNLVFLAASSDCLPFRSSSTFDLVTCFETIEHLPLEGQRRSIEEAKRVLSPGGTLLISTPNKAVYSDRTEYQNPFHMREFYEEALRSLLGEFFENVHILGQAIYTASHMWPVEGGPGESVEFGLRYSPPGFSPSEVVREPRYFVVACSDQTIPLPSYSYGVDLSGAHLGVRDRRLDLLKDEASSLRDELATLAGERETLLAEAALAKSELESTEQRSREERQSLTGTIEEMQSLFRANDSSLATQLIRQYRRAREKVMPAGSFRRLMYEKVVALLKAILNQPRGTPNLLSNEAAIPVQDGISLPEQGVTDMLEGEKYRNSYMAGLAVAAGPLGEGSAPPLQRPDQKLTAGLRVLAFYLPQYHPIPENDTWWGRGFTDWTNVAKAIPQFIGHYQPHLPGELGFYDLRVPEVQRRQVELARQSGIFGFCFYYYWFGGKRLLYGPLEQFASNPEIRYPFCVCWANENWTRRWDGRDDDILVAQAHSPATDLAFIRDLEPLLRHPDYIRVHGRPLILVYRPRLLPDPQGTAERWREDCLEAGLGNPYLVAAQVFEPVDPRELGYDAAVEFPPNLPHNLPLLNQSVQLLNPLYEGRIHHYADLARMMMNRPRPDYLLFKTVVPGWDNEARRPGRGSTFAFSTPQSYKAWLEAASRYALEDSDSQRRMVFINAWNEWAEGAHLEPDRRDGSSYLEATAEAISSATSSKGPRPGQWKILFVSHDANRGGAQAVLLNLLEWIVQRTAVEAKVLCLEGGEWLPRFEQLADTQVLSQLSPAGSSVTEEDVARLIEGFCGGPPALIYGNSVAAGRAYGILRHMRVPILTHVHELASSVNRYASTWFSEVLDLSSGFIACSEAVRQYLLDSCSVDPSKVARVYAGINPSLSEFPLDRHKKRALRKRLGLRPDTMLVIGCGIGAAERKGADLFIEIARELLKRGRDDFRFYWVGGFDDEEPMPDGTRWKDCLSRMRHEGLGKYVSLLGWREAPRDYLQAADVFLLPSREDPFPLVALEAAEAGLPIVCFSGAGGAPEFVGQDAGIAVPLGDVSAMAEAVMNLLGNGELRRTVGQAARNRLLADFTSSVAMPALFSVCRRIAGKKPAVTVIVPNYNHAEYLPRRLDSIFSQTFQDLEVILLDDASTDGSLPILEECVGRPDMCLVRNASNSGSTFRQWLKGMELARGEIVWVAESDDACEQEFLSTLLPGFEDPRVRLVYSNSYVMDEQGRVIGDYLTTDYLATLSRHKWAKSYQVPADQEVNDGLGVKNTLLSSSAVLRRNLRIDEDTADTVRHMKFAGDWLLNLYCIQGGHVRYDSRKLSYHRRHSESVIAKMVSEHHVQRFFKELHICHEFATKAFFPSPQLSDKKESYLRRQWDDFFPERPFDEIALYYGPEQAPGLNVHYPTVGASHPRRSRSVGTIGLASEEQQTYSAKAEKVVLEAQRAVYVVIPKTGCTTIKKFFSDWHSWSEVENVHNPASEIYQHIVNEDLRSPMFEGYFKFTFVRNPFSRLYSAYKSKVSAGVAGPKYIDGVELGLYRMGVRRGHSFKQFVELLSSLPDEACDPHVKPQWHFVMAEDGQLLVDQWFLFEAFTTEFAALLRHLRMPLPAAGPPHENRTLIEPLEYAGAYDEETTSLVVARYEQDFHLFGYHRSLFPEP